MEKRRVLITGFFTNYASNTNEAAEEMRLQIM
jgi:hypothetical protein